MPTSPSVVLDLKGTKQMQGRIRNLTRKIPDAAGTALTLEAEHIARDSKDNYIPVDEGALRSSEHVTKPERNGLDITVKIVVGGPAAPYALCVFGAKHKVPTNNGIKQIGSVNVGDKVLTQTGEWKSVTSVNRMPASLKPNLVTIESVWRRGKNHILTVTDDHPLLVFRGGRNKWICARDLDTTDRLYHRSKEAHNKGDRKYKYTCCMCNKTFGDVSRRRQKNKRVYCSIECKNKGYNTHRHPTKGKKRSAKSMAPARKALADKRWNGSTEVEAKVSSWMESRGLEFQREVKIGNHWVDFYVPEHKLIVEADGAYWHQDQMYDIERDKKLLDSSLEGTRVLHIHFYNSRFSPQDLDLNPLPGVYYVSCNPGTSSFCDPETFSLTPIVSIRKWKYTGNSAWLYDLSVEGVHSFVVSGVVVHNSVHEHPSKYSPPSWQGKEITFSPQGRGPKYLEKPFNEALPGMSARLAKRISDSLE